MANQHTKLTQDPNKKNSPGEILNDEGTDIVNSEEQAEVVNTPGAANPSTEESQNKQKGYEEGNRNDSLTEPEMQDSDDQLEFPDEEGK